MARIEGWLDILCYILAVDKNIATALSSYQEVSSLITDNLPLGITAPMSKIADGMPRYWGYFSSYQTSISCPGRMALKER